MFNSKREDLEKMDPKVRKRIEKDIEKKRKKENRKYFFQKLKHRMGDKPMQYKEIEVPDFNDRCVQLSDFRNAYQAFFQNRLQENAELQNHTTQMLWHRLYLQKLRLDRLGITMAIDSKRVKRTAIEKDSIVEKTSFDGRYEVNEVNEAISAKRRFLFQDREVGSFDNHESLNYYIFSTKKQGPTNIVCPNCGSESTRENLIDGCDYCCTKFTIEDLEDKVGSFDFQFEYADKETSKKAREAHSYFSQEGTKLVNNTFDPIFSMREFSENVFNKLAAIHYADSEKQINAFSDCDLKTYMETYKNVVNMDPWDIRLAFFDSYHVENNLQKIRIQADFYLFELVDDKILIRNEVVRATLEKSAECKTQAICGPNVFTCKGCGQSLSLMDGKACPYCGRELNMREYDWVITEYESILQDYKTRLYEI